jgi:hypothetical protein
MIHLVPYLSMDVVFPKVAKYLEKAINHEGCSSWTITSLYSACATRQAYLFVDDLIDPKNAGTVQFQIWGGRTVCYIMFLGGEGGMDWRKEMRQFRQFAHSMGVTQIYANVRDGLLRVFSHKRIVTLIEILEDEPDEQRPDGKNHNPV